MAIAWGTARRLVVDAVLVRHPVNSGRCEEAARAILRVAREIDLGAKRWLVEPTEGRFVAPKVEQDPPWRFHYTVEAQAHCVDVLTGADGVPQSQYRDLWQHPDSLRWIPADD